MHWINQEAASPLEEITSTRDDHTNVPMIDSRTMFTKKIVTFTRSCAQKGNEYLEECATGILIHSGGWFTSAVEANQDPAAKGASIRGFRTTYPTT
jgi:hypothetical protein